MFFFNCNTSSFSSITMTSKVVVVFLSCFVLFLFYSCHAVDTILAGQSIQDGQNITSPDGSFVLGFFSPGGENQNRYVGIWYNTNKISVQTVVWVANRDNPIQDRSGNLTIGRDGNLVVLDGIGRSLWSTNVSNVPSNSSVILRDLGNLLLCNGDEVSCNPGNALWHSFDEPTDTYLPGMRVALNPRRNESHFTSWKSETDPSRGNFSLGVNPQGLPEFVIWEGSRKAWRSGLWNGQIFVGVPNMTANILYGFNLDRDREGAYFTYTVNNSSQTVRFRVRWDGREEQLLWDEGKKTWTTFWTQPTSVCEHYNRCGAFGICGNSDSPLCSCLRGFDPASRTDWDSGNWTGGCVRRTELQCDRNITSAGEGDQFFEVDRVKLPDFSVTIPINNRDNCAQMCLNNCSCKAYAYVSAIQCLTWSQDFVDIQKFEEGGQTLYIRLAASELGTSKNQLTLIIVLVVVLGAIFILCTAAYIFWRCRSKSRNSRKEPVTVDETRSREFWTEFSAHEDIEGNPAGNGPDLPMYSLQDIVTATNNFSSVDKLGEGGFGPVFKGKLPCGKEVAVKRLSRKSGQGIEEFKNEIILIAKLQHRNLVRLLGYCVEGEEKILLYEFLRNKSLDAFIFAKTKEQLNWRQRLNIIEGIARGLLYLHRDSRLRIIHRDLKASNILLDEEMKPKISDFGMAKIFGGNENEGNTNRVVGTYGYMAPEYAMEGLFSVKSDVYSFGVLLLEIVSGKKNQFRHPDYDMNLIGYAWNLWGEERAIEFVDPSIRDSCSNQSSVMRCINVGLLCVQDSPNDRPIMSTVVLMLESDTAILPTPRQPTFTMGRNPMKMELSTDSSEVLKSKNNMTNTMVVGR